MARSLTPRDCHALMNLLVKEATGQDATLQAVDASTFVSCGEAVLASGMENTLNALSLILGRTFVAARPYNAKLNILNRISTGEYSHRLRKISFYSKDAVASGDWNTQSYTNLSPGFTAGENESGGTPQSTKSQWEQMPAVPLELNFAGQDVWEDGLTRYEYQVRQAFRSEADFAEFVTGMMVEKGNDIESQKEQFNRLAVLNRIAGLYDLGAAVVAKGLRRNMTYEYNQKFGTSYTTAQLLGAQLKSFLEFFVAEFKKESDWMTNRSATRHWSPAKTIGGVSYTLLRHTPKDRQRAILYRPLITESEARVMPEIFNPQYLNINNYEGVDYWQNPNDPMNIDFIPAIPDTTAAGFPTVSGSEVKDIVVLGLLYDADALMIDYQLESATATALEARKHYSTLWWSFSKNIIDDYTENSVLFFMEDPGE